MRCPKCGYISFDHIDTCLRCNKDISGEVEVEGTTYHAVAPSFLRVPTKSDDEEDELQAEEFEDDGFELSDPDLAVLSTEDDEVDFLDDEEDVADDVAMEAADEGIDFQLESDEEVEDEGFDFDFEDDDGAAPPVPEEEERLSFTVPEDLADISDLAPPVRERVSPGDSGSGMDISLDDEMDLDDSLDLDGLDLDLGLGAIGSAGDADLKSLSLDDIDLSEEDIALDDTGLEGVSMDLDLDGLDEKPKPEKEKSPGSLDGLSLSLD